MSNDVENLYDVTVNSMKFDRRIHRSWRAKLIEKSDPLLVFIGEFENEVTHQHLGIIRRGTVSYEYYWLNKNYNVFRFHEPEGELRNFYCNLNLLPSFDGKALNYVDLEIDVLVWRDFSYQILDTEEFEENAKIFGYSEKLKNEILTNLDELISLIENKTFPFDYSD